MAERRKGIKRQMKNFVRVKEKEFYFGGKPVHAQTPCNCGYYYSSIIGNGAAEFIEDPDEKRYALGKMFEHQAGKKTEFTEQQVGSVCVFKIVARDFTGKRKQQAGAENKKQSMPEV